MTAFEYIKTHVNVKLGVSRINGVGVFALREIEEGEILFTPWKGKTGIYELSNYELSLLDDNIKMHIFDMFEYVKVDNVLKFYVHLNENCYWIFQTPYHWVNSCSYNEDPSVDKEKLIVLRKIKEGEELLFKYGKYEKFNRYTRTI